MSSVLTYESLYEALRREKTAPDLQILSKEFFRQVVEYLEEKEALLKKHQDPIELQKSQLQLANIKKMIREVYERRESKIFQLSLFASRTHEKPDLSPLLPEEKELFNSFLELLNDFREGILTNMLAARQVVLKPKAKPLKTELGEAKSTQTIRLLHAVPQFVGDDLQIYGPFEPEDVAAVPMKVAEVLVQKGRAENI
ncbi:MAG: hypothetical protein Q7R96_03610 [Nanoarchaeota archaeon]|nr:hypothetical protein [Nanoarchaeota archaeon]